MTLARIPMIFSQFFLTSRLFNQLLFFHELLHGNSALHLQEGADAGLFRKEGGFNGTQILDPN